MRAARLPGAGPDDRVFSHGCGARLGHGGGRGGLRRRGRAPARAGDGFAMARLADAMVSAFLVNVEPGCEARNPSDWARPRQRRSVHADADREPRSTSCCASTSSRPGARSSATRPRASRPSAIVGFVDLVGSTALAQRLSTRELGPVLTEFEHMAADSVTAAGGRVVKLIGDEVLYHRARPRRPPARSPSWRRRSPPPARPDRAGRLASGDVLLRDGDVFGPVVNLAARAVKAAAARRGRSPGGGRGGRGHPRQSRWASTSSKASTTTSSCAGC